MTACSSRRSRPRAGGRSAGRRATRSRRRSASRRCAAIGPAAGAGQAVAAQRGYAARPSRSARLGDRRHDPAAERPHAGVSAAGGSPSGRRRQERVRGGPRGARPRGAARAAELATGELLAAVERGSAALGSAQVGADAVMSLGPARHFISGFPLGAEADGLLDRHDIDADTRRTWASSAARASRACASLPPAAVRGRRVRRRASTCSRCGAAARPDGAERTAASRSGASACHGERQDAPPYFWPITTCAVRARRS